MIHVYTAVSRHSATCCSCLTPHHSAGVTYQAPDRAFAPLTPQLQSLRLEIQGLYPQQAARPSSGTAAVLEPQAGLQLGARRSQHHQHQATQASINQSEQHTQQLNAAAWLPQLQRRPLHVQHHVHHMQALLRACDSTIKLQTVLAAHLHHLPPSCLTAAMQQLQVLRRQDLHAAAGNQGISSSSSSSSYVLQLQLAGQVTTAMLRQLPAASGGCLAAFLAAAAGMRLVMPPAVLEQLAAHLIHRALRQACEQHKQHSRVSNKVQPAGHQQEQQQQVMSSPGTEPEQLAPAQQQQQPDPPHAVAVTAWALAKLHLRPPGLWSELSSLAGEQVKQLSPRDCVLLAWSLAKIGHHQPRLLHALQLRLKPHVQQLAPDSISILLWSYARAEHYHHRWVATLVGAAADRMECFSPRALATSLWACARMRHADPRMLSAMRVRALASMPDMGAQALANLAWSLPNLGIADEALTAAVMDQALLLVDSFTIQGLANVAWAVAKLQQRARGQQGGDSTGSQHRGMSRSSSNPTHQGGQGQHSLQQQKQQACSLLGAICTSAAARLELAQPQEVCNLLWACATLKLRHGPFMAAAAGRLAAVAEEASPLDLAQALWALETLRFRRKSTQQALLLPALNKLHHFGPQALSNLAWAVASNGMQCPGGLPAAVAQQLQSLLPEMSPQGLATTLWALSKMGPVQPQLIHAASSHILEKLHMYNTQDLCNLAMVCAKAGYREAPLLQGLAAAACDAASSTATAVAAGCSHSNIGHRSSSGSKRQAAAQIVPQPLHAAWLPLPRQREEDQYCLSFMQPAYPSLAPAASPQYSRHKQLTAQGVCNLVWAFAGMGWHDPLMMQQIQQLAVLQLPQMQPRHIAGLSQGFALLREPFQVLLTTVERGLPAGKHGRKGNHEATTAAAEGMQSGQQEQQQLQYHHQHQHQQLQQRIHRCSMALQSWSPDSLALLVHSMAVTGAHTSHAALLLAALQILSRRVSVKALLQQRRCQLHFALTLLAMHWHVAEVVDAPGGQQHNSSNGSSSYGNYGGSAINGLGERDAVRQAVLSAFSAEQCGGSCVELQEVCAACKQHQQQAQAAAAAPAAARTGTGSPHVAGPSPARSLRGGLCEAAASVLSGGLVQTCSYSWQQSQQARHLSRVEHELVQALQSMGLQPLVQHWVHLATADHQTTITHGLKPSRPQSWRALKIKVGLSAGTLDLDNGPVAFDVVPPAAVSSSEPRRLLGQSALQQECLAAAGWQVVTLTWDDWDSLRGDVGKQQQLVHQYLHTRVSLRHNV